MLTQNIKLYLYFTSVYCVWPYIAIIFSTGFILRTKLFSRLYSMLLYSFFHPYLISYLYLIPFPLHSKSYRELIQIFDNISIPRTKLWPREFRSGLFVYFLVDILLSVAGHIQCIHYCSQRQLVALSLITFFLLVSKIMILW